MPERIVIVGSSCAGKSTLADRIAEARGIPHVCLDELHWLPGWKERPLDEFRPLVADAVAGDAWVVDGNYSKVRDAIWPRATTVLWLNYSFPVVWARAMRRTISRSITGEELYNGNRESWRQSFFSRESILWWILTTFRSHRRMYRELIDTNAFPHVEWFELRRPAEAEAWLRDRLRSR